MTELQIRLRKSNMLGCKLISLEVFVKQISLSSICPSYSSLFTSSSSCCSSSVLLFVLITSGILKKKPTFFDRWQRLFDVITVLLVILCFSNLSEVLTADLLSFFLQLTNTWISIQPHLTHLCGCVWTRYIRVIVHGVFTLSTPCSLSIHNNIHKCSLECSLTL